MEHTICVNKKDPGWVEGTIGSFCFQAKMYETGSKFGIHSGRVSKLAVWAETGDIIAYDRGWSQRPACDEHWELLLELLNYLGGSSAGEKGVCKK